VHEAAERGMAALRLYQWQPATLSLGYFQSAAVRLSDARLAPLPWVRRPSGGAALVHDHELTYALVLPPGPAWRSGELWMARMHRIIAAALGLGSAVAPKVGATVKHDDVLCFQQHTPGDLLCKGVKVVGSAQRKYHLAMMQHGSILLARSEHTPALPGLRELTGALMDVPALVAALPEALGRDTGWRLETTAWSPGQREAIAKRADEKYRQPSWNERR
jgi:lipoyl(octanoyl) transferase